MNCSVSHEMPITDFCSSSLVKCTKPLSQEDDSDSDMLDLSTCASFTQSQASLSDFSDDESLPDAVEKEDAVATLGRCEDLSKALTNEEEGGLDREDGRGMYRVPRC